MASLQTAFEQLTGPQAEILSAAATLLSALIVALVAPLVFHLLTRRGVRDFNTAVAELQGAAESARTQAQTIRDTMGSVRAVSSQVTELGVLVASVQEALANTQNTLLESHPDQSLLPANGNSEQHETNRDVVKRLWRGLQEEIERQAASPEVDGRTRAKYARVDRRGYLRLIELLRAEGNLIGDFNYWREAYGIASNAIHASEAPSAASLQRMQQLTSILMRKEDPPAVPPASSSTRPLPRATDDFTRALRTRVPRPAGRPDTEPPQAPH